MMKKRLFSIGLICMSLLLGQFLQLGSMIASAAEEAGTERYEMSVISSDASLSGAYTSRQEYFQVPEHWEVDGATLHLDYQVSQLAIEDRSSITLQMNGASFYSFRPDPNKEGKQRLTVAIPPEVLTAGTNTLALIGNVMTIIDDVLCLPEDSRDNWLQLYSSSSVSFSYSTSPLDGTIRDFAKRFTSLESMGKSLNAITIPQEASAAEMGAAVQALSGFSKSNSQQDKQIPLITFDNPYYDSKELVTAVGLYDRLPANLQSALGNPDLEGQALISLVEQDGQWVLIVTSKDDALLVKAGRLLANSELMSQLDGNSKVVDANTDVSTPPVGISQNIVLTEAGDTLTGPRHQEKAYFVSLPANRSIADASKISLDFRYAKNLNFENSVVTVLINNTPIGSKKLSEELADGDSMTLTIPKNLNISGNFSVVVAFDLELENAACIQTQSYMPWAFVTKDSVMQLNTKDRTELLFNNYPYPFLRDGVFNEVAVILPKERDTHTYFSVSNLFNLLGQYAEGNTGNVVFYEDDVAPETLKKHNVIAIGSYQNNKVIRDVNDNLYFKYDSAGNGLLSNEKMSIDSQYGTRLGTLQLLESPFDSGHGLLAVTAADPQFYQLASKLVASQQTMWRVFGDGVTVDRDGNINAFRFKQDAEQDRPSAISNITERTDVLYFTVAAGLVLVLVLVSLILLFRKYRKRGDRDNA
ncbi:cellulose biosynthesis cyclic di-GMP-binding regulatory protein BcsB [Paenibacillus sp. CAU 1782]